jgi:rhamnosyltransferase
MINKDYCHDIAAILVTYNPNSEALQMTIQAVLDQVSDVFIVDNGSSNFSPNWLDKFENHANTKLHLLPQRKNLGIGAAHNIGVKLAIAQGAKFILLLDQDSQIGSDMVTKLSTAYNTLTEQHVKVAAIGSQYHDADNGELSQFAKIERGRFVFSDAVDNNPIINTEDDSIALTGKLNLFSAQKLLVSERADYLVWTNRGE